jgi:hypothetical protein
MPRKMMLAVLNCIHGSRRLPDMNGRRRAVVLAVLPFAGLLLAPLLGCDMPRRHSYSSGSPDYYGNRDSDEQRELAAHQREERRSLDRGQEARDRSYEGRHSWWPFWR